MAIENEEQDVPDYPPAVLSSPRGPLSVQGDFFLFPWFLKKWSKNLPC